MSQSATLGETPRTDALYCPDMGTLLVVPTNEGYAHACQLEIELGEAMAPRWTHVHSKDELEAFYRSVLKNISKEAEYHGYAIGVHGSLRRDLDLIAVPWKDDHSDKDDLARAIQEAACGFPQEVYQWEQKPCGRLAVSFPVCWTEKSDGFPAETNLGHIDLSVMSGGRS